MLSIVCSANGFVYNDLVNGKFFSQRLTTWNLQHFDWEIRF